jgi:hypothetical protein
VPSYPADVYTGTGVLAPIMTGTFGWYIAEGNVVDGPPLNPTWRGVEFRVVVERW